MLRWRFATFLSSAGRNDVQECIDSYDDYGREAFSRQVAHLAVSAKEQWGEPHAKKIKNEDPLYEIRYKANHCATRALGFFGPVAQTFTITLICTHKQNVYKPPGAFKTARTRATKIENGSAKTVPLQVLGETFPPDDD